MMMYSTEELVSMCDEVSSLWMRVWELERQVADKQGGPSFDEVDDAMDKAFAWHDVAESLKAKGA